MTNPNSPLPWHIVTLGTPDPLERIEHKDSPGAELRDALSRPVAIFPCYNDAEYVLSLFDKIAELENEIESLT